MEKCTHIFLTHSFFLLMFVVLIENILKNIDSIRFFYHTFFGKYKFFLFLKSMEIT